MHQRSHRLPVPRSWRPGMRGSRILICCLLLAATTAALLYGQRAQTVGMPASLRSPPPTALDLRDRNARDALREIVQRPRIEGTGAGDSLFNRCSEYSSDVYAALSKRAFFRPLYVEIRRTTNGDDATALSWNADAEPRLRGMPPRQRTRPPAPLHQRPVKAEDVAEIEARFLVLAQSESPRVKARAALDGGSLLLEFCRSGQYGLFFRENYSDDDDDRRIAELGDRLLELSATKHQEETF